MRVIDLSWMQKGHIIAGGRPLPDGVRHLGDLRSMGDGHDNWHVLVHPPGDNKLIAYFQEGSILTDVNAAHFLITPEALRFRGRTLIRIANMVLPESRPYWGKD